MNLEKELWALFSILGPPVPAHYMNFLVPRPNMILHLWLQLKYLLSSIRHDPWGHIPRPKNAIIPKQKPLSSLRNKATQNSHAGILTNKRLIHVSPLQLFFPIYHFFMKLDILLLLLFFGSTTYGLLPNLANGCGSSPRIFVKSFPRVSTGFSYPEIEGMFWLDRTYDALAANTVPDKPKAVEPKFDFWKAALEVGEKAILHAKTTIEKEFVKYSTPLEMIEELQNAVNGLTKKIKELEAFHGEHLNINVTQLNRLLSAEIESATKTLMKETQSWSQSQSRKNRKAIVIKALDMIEDVLVKINGLFQVPEREVRRNFGRVKPRIKHFVLLIGEFFFIYSSCLSVTD